MEIKTLGKVIYVELEQLQFLLKNLLQIIYLEPEALKLHKEYRSLIELIYEAKEVISKKLGQQEIIVEIAEDMPMVLIDNKLIKDVFIHLLDNAIKFTKENTPVYISAKEQKHKIIVAVLDEGPGIAEAEINKLFDKFYRGQTQNKETDQVGA